MNETRIRIKDKAAQNICALLDLPHSRYAYVMFGESQTRVSFEAHAQQEEVRLSFELSDHGILSDRINIEHPTAPWRDDEELRREFADLAIPGRTSDVKAVGKQILKIAIAHFRQTVTLGPDESRKVATAMGIAKQEQIGGVRYTSLHEIAHIAHCRLECEHASGSTALTLWDGGAIEISRRHKDSRTDHFLHTGIRLRQTIVSRSGKLHDSYFPASHAISEIVRDRSRRSFGLAAHMYPNMR